MKQSQYMYQVVDTNGVVRRVTTARSDARDEKRHQLTRGIKTRIVQFSASKIVR